MTIGWSYLHVWTFFRFSQNKGTDTLYFMTNVKESRRIFTTVMKTYMQLTPRWGRVECSIDRVYLRSLLLYLRYWFRGYPVYYYVVLPGVSPEGTSGCVCGRGCDPATGRGSGGLPLKNWNIAANWRSQSIFRVCLTQFLCHPNDI
jgi:hypothetical protein